MDIFKLSGKEINEMRKKFHKTYIGKNIYNIMIIILFSLIVVEVANIFLFDDFDQLFEIIFLSIAILFSIYHEFLFVKFIETRKDEKNLNKDNKNVINEVNNSNEI